MKRNLTYGLLTVLMMVMTMFLGSCTYNDAVSALGTGLGDLEILLKSQSYQFSGTVYDQYGQPVKNARVAAYSLKRGVETYTAVTTTSEAGIYQLELQQDSLLYSLTLKVLTDEKSTTKDYISKGDSATFYAADITGVQACDFHVNVEYADTTSKKGDDDGYLDYLISTDLKDNHDGYYIASLRRHNLIDGNTLSRVQVDLISRYDNNSFTQLFRNAAGQTVSDAQMIISSVYTETEARSYSNNYVASGTRASQKNEDVMLYGVKVACNKDYTMNVTATDEARIRFHLDNLLASKVELRKLDGENWVKVPFDREKDESGSTSLISFTPVGYGVYALFVDCKTTISDSQRKETIHSRWDNPLPSNYPDFTGTVKVLEFAEYAYTMGVSYDIKRGTTVGQALLLEYVYCKYGSQQNEFVGRFDLNKFELRPGFSLVLSGWQDFVEYTFSICNDACSVRMDKAGSISFSMAEYTVDHNGGDF